MSPPSPIRALAPPTAPKGPVMGVFPASSSSTAQRTIIQSKTKRALFPPKSKLSRKSPSKKTQLSTSPTGFFTHPSFSAPTISRRREMVLSPTRGPKANARPGVMKTIDEKARAADKNKKMGGGKKNGKAMTERGLSSRPQELVVEADDIQAKIASSSTGLHPSSDPVIALEDFFTHGSDNQHDKFDDVLHDLPPSSPPVFGLAELSDAVDSSPVMRALASSAGNSVSSVHQVGHDATTSSPIAVSRKRKSHPAPTTPPSRSHPAQKVKVSARTLAVQGNDLPVVRIVYDGTYALVLGRSRRALATCSTGAQQEESSSSTDIQPVATTLSSEVSEKLLTGAAEEGKLAPLPRSASHASRSHVLLQVVPQQDRERLVVSVLGQNGCRIRRLPFRSAHTTDYAEDGEEAGKRYPIGSEVDFSRSMRGGKTVRLEVDMYSCRAIIDWLPRTVKPSLSATVVSTPAKPVAPAQEDLPAEAPAAESKTPAQSIDAQLAELLHTPVVRKSSSSAGGGKRRSAGRKHGSSDEIPVTPESVRSIHSQMTYDSSASLSDEEEEAVMEEGDEEEEEEAACAAPLEDVTEDLDSRQVKQEMLDTCVAPRSTPAAAPGFSSTTEGAEKKENIVIRESAEPPAVPVDIDLKALVATSLVFSGSSAISCPDLVKAILDVSCLPSLAPELSDVDLLPLRVQSQPSMKSYGREAVWSVWIQNTLDSHPMFGRVDRKGKDASGKPLLPLFHYVPAEDYDQTRAAELGGLMRPLRGTQRGGGKAIDWRPVGGRRR
ncbi:hypothetical protein QFC22_001197 [Naganishia vaughanmartiniae]|uniref:Uncharacterized protein n=1 Tax=Naganishia vaughanmartiniae TaxID=1424756 RepID=A0ACC2XNX1_9TREE|nr:hypothetical protein QFC22_001197 [Naganishia vaughanmartiniae]